jgi:hypothetical protein
MNSGCYKGLLWPFGVARRRRRSSFDAISAWRQLLFPELGARD